VRASPGDATDTECVDEVGQDLLGFCEGGARRPELRPPSRLSSGYKVLPRGGVAERGLPVEPEVLWVCQIKSAGVLGSAKRDEPGPVPKRRAAKPALDGLAPAIGLNNHIDDGDLVEVSSPRFIPAGGSGDPKCREVASPETLHVRLAFDECDGASAPC